MATSKKGTSMLYLQKQLGIGSYRTVWLMGHKIREAMTQRDAQYTLKGTVQADEIFIGGKQTLEDRRKFGTNKTPFFIGVEEGPKETPRFVTFQELEKVWEEHILPAIEKKIQKGSTIKSDGAAHYSAAEKKMGYGHERSVAMDDPKKTAEHLKWVNMLTSNLKRFLLSTYHGVFPKYRDAYLAEFAYRFNRRYWPYQAFDRLLYACLKGTPTTLCELSA
jgi:transposase-like protein